MPGIYGLCSMSSSTGCSKRDPPQKDAILATKALGYACNQEKELRRVLEDGRLPLDNTRSERSLRKLVLGRKNHHGSRSERGTQVAALLYSLIDSAQLAGVNPHDYLRRGVRAALDGVQIPLPHEIR